MTLSLAVATLAERVCIAAGNLELDSPSLNIVQQLLPACHDIAKTVYRRAVKLYASHQSRWGKLSHPGVMALAIRDLEMMQGYLWLCILDNNFAAVEQELIPLYPPHTYATIENETPLFAEPKRLLLLGESDVWQLYIELV